MRLLRTEIRKLEQKIDMDEKMKKMGDMQLSTVTDAKKRKTILEQVQRRVSSHWMDEKGDELCVKNSVNSKIKMCHRTFLL